MGPQRHLIALDAELRWIGPYAAVTLLLFLLAQALALTNDLSPLTVIGAHASQLLALTPFMAVAAVALFLAADADPQQPYTARTTLKLIRSRFASKVTAPDVLIPILLMPVMLGSFGTIKMLMPRFRPFSWDDTLASIDRALFLGTDPWVITHAVFGHPLLTRMIDTIYSLWVPGLLIAVLAASVGPRLARARFFLSFVAAWLLIGVVGAYLLSSAGPCYADRLGAATGPWFTPLMERLTDEHLAALLWQEVLWTAYLAGEFGFGRGISAAPSMHNAISMLYVLALANARPLFRIGSRIFAAIIFIGSVHLGWHYAVDGLIAFAAILAIWKAAGTYLDWCGYSSEVARQSANGAGQGSGDGEAEPFPT